MLNTFHFLQRSMWHAAQPGSGTNQASTAQTRTPVETTGVPKLLQRMACTVAQTQANEHHTESNGLSICRHWQQPPTQLYRNEDATTQVRAREKASSIKLVVRLAALVYQINKNGTITCKLSRYTQRHTSPWGPASSMTARTTRSLRQHPSAVAATMISSGAVACTQAWVSTFWTH